MSGEHTSISEAVARRFDKEAPAYRESMAALLHPAGRRLLEKLVDTGRPPGRPWIVDVGTGVGTLLEPIQRAVPGARVLGVDRSLGMLAHAPHATSRANMDAARLALADHTVDWILAAFVLFFLDEPLAGLREAARILRGGGRIGLATWANTLESPALSVWYACLSEFDPDPPSAEPWNFSASDTCGKVERLLRGAGFTQVHTEETELVARLEVEHLLRLKTTVGRDKRFFDALSACDRERCLALARRRLAKLDDEDFLARAKVIYGTGRVPAPGA